MSSKNTTILNKTVSEAVKIFNSEEEEMFIEKTNKTFF